LKIMRDLHTYDKVSAYIRVEKWCIRKVFGRNSFLRNSAIISKEIAFFKCFNYQSIPFVY
jgi:hypothetical protein